MIQKEMIIKITRDEVTGYSYALCTPDERPYIVGTDSNPYSILDTLGNEFYEIGWRDINDS
jgi:hypothetical protein